jgi:pyruvate dehydrogenase E1 component
VAVSALKALAEQGEIAPSVVSAAIKKFGLDTDKPDPTKV